MAKGGKQVTLRQRQSVFAKNVALLLLFAYEQGYEVTFGEAWRPPATVAVYAEDGRGSGSSVHPLRLAVDLNLFKAGRYLRSTQAHEPLGRYWKSLHPDNRWGGDFSGRKDGNHYSMRWGRRA